MSSGEAVPHMVDALGQDRREILSHPTLDPARDRGVEDHDAGARQDPRAQHLRSIGVRMHQPGDENFPDLLHQQPRSRRELRLEMRQAMKLGLVLRPEGRERTSLELGEDSHDEGDVILAGRPSSQGILGILDVESPPVEEQVLLGREVAEERPSPDSRRSRDLVDRDVSETAPVQKPQRGIDDRL